MSNYEKTIVGVVEEYSLPAGSELECSLRTAHPSHDALDRGGARAFHMYHQAPFPSYSSCYRSGIFYNP